MQKIIFLSFIITLLLFTGCSSKKTKIYQKKQTTSLKKYNKKTEFKAPKNSNYKTKALYRQYNKWKGAKYKLGGQNLSGVDCSSFVQQVYFDAFGLRVPRTTSKQALSGSSISKNKLHAGDMILFKTAFNVRHVGIIISNGKFIHASTSYGVVISSVQNPYWKSKYWQSRRVLP